MAEEIVLSSSNARVYAEAQLKELGIELPKAPDKSVAPTMPINITRIELDELGRLLGIYTAWTAFIEPQVALADVDYTCALQTLEYQQNLLILKPICQMHEQASERKAIRDVQPEILKLKKIMLKQEARFKVLASMLKVYLGNMSTLSREISRRSLVENIGKGSRFST